MAASPAISLAIEINLTAVILVITGDQPAIYASAFDQGGAQGLPSGPFNPLAHRTLELGLRGFVKDQAKLALGYVEQLYTFGDRGRHAVESDSVAGVPHVVSVGYLALTRVAAGTVPKGAFHGLYTFFPWEDWREGEPAVLRREIRPRLDEWAREETPTAGAQALSRAGRIAMLFGDTPDEEKVLERYELLYEAGLLLEAARDGRIDPDRALPELGRMMQFDHRRMLATALGRIRAKLKYRPLIFELMEPSFTLTALQKRAEAMSGRHLHKQNFRRLVEAGGLVEPTGEQTTTGGRPAALFRFRRDVITERPAPGLRVSRSG